MRVAATRLYLPSVAFCLSVYVVGCGQKRADSPREPATTSAPTTASSSTSSTTPVPFDPDSVICSDVDLEAMLVDYPPGAFTELWNDAALLMLAAENFLDAGSVESADVCLDRLFDEYPIGDAVWGSDPWMPHDANIGWPPGYYGARMLRDIVDYRMSGVDTIEAKINLTVALPGCSEGIEPRSAEELELGGGVHVFHDLDPALLEDDARIIHQSLHVFSEYVSAATDGRLGVEVRVEHLPNVCVPVVAGTDPLVLATIGDPMPVFDALSHLQSTTDWWWIIYPSHVPEAYPDFVDTEFITGGMGRGPQQRAPAFLIDDRWLLRKPPHLGKGLYSEAERRLYLPQWLQHEFFHHLFATWPEFNLEDDLHQWFDRSTWPADFTGAHEADYYAEALHKRLKIAEPPMHVSLRYALASEDGLAPLTTTDVLGTYEHLPVENGWHSGEITGTGNDLLWTNSAGASWALTADLANGRLTTGADCPYVGDPGADAFALELARDDDGNYLPEVVAFWFTGQRYGR